MANTSVIGKQIVPPTIPEATTQEIAPATPPGPGDYSYLMLRLELAQKKDKKAVNQDPLPRMVKRALARLHQEDPYLRIIPKCDWPKEFDPINLDKTKKYLQIDANRVPTDAKEFDAYFEYTNKEVHPYEPKQIVVRFRVKTTKDFKTLKTEQVKQFLRARAQFLNQSFFIELEEATVGFYYELHTKFANFDDLSAELITRMQNPQKTTTNEEENETGETKTDMNTSEETDFHIPAFTLGCRNVITGMGDDTTSTYAVCVRTQASDKKEMNEILQNTTIHCGSYCYYSVTKHPNVQRAVKLQTRFMDKTTMIKLLGIQYKGLFKRFYHNGKATSVARELVQNGIHGLHRPTDKERKCIYLVCDASKEEETKEYIDKLMEQVNSLPPESRDTIVLPDWVPRRSKQKDNSDQNTQYDNMSGKTGYWNTDVSTIPSKPKNAWNRPPEIIMHQTDQRSSSPVSTMAESNRSAVTLEEVSQIVKESNAELKRELQAENDQKLGALKSEFDEKLQAERDYQRSREERQAQQHEAIMKMFEWMREDKEKKQLNKTRRRILDDSDDDAAMNPDSNAGENYNSQNDDADDDNPDDDIDHLDNLTNRAVSATTSPSRPSNSQAQQDQNHQKQTTHATEPRQTETARQPNNMSVSNSLPEDTTIIFNDNESPSKLSISSIRSEYDKTALVPRQQTTPSGLITQPEAPSSHQFVDRSLGLHESRYYLHPSITPAAPEKRVRFHPRQEIEKYYAYRHDNGLPRDPDPQAHEAPYLTAQPQQWMHSQYGINHPRHHDNIQPLPYYPPATVLQAEHMYYQQSLPQNQYPPPVPPQLPPIQPGQQYQPTHDYHNTQSDDQFQSNAVNQSFSATEQQTATEQQFIHPQTATEQPGNTNQPTQPTALKQGDGGEQHE